MDQRRKDLRQFCRLLIHPPGVPRRVEGAVRPANAKRDDPLPEIPIGSAIGARCARVAAQLWTSQIHLYPAASHANSIMAAGHGRRGTRPSRTDGRRGARNQGYLRAEREVRIQFSPAVSLQTFGSSASNRVKPYLLFPWAAEP